jgi:hypothetical protein
MDEVAQAGTSVQATRFSAQGRRLETKAGARKNAREEMSKNVFAARLTCYCYCALFNSEPMRTLKTKSKCKNEWGMGKIETNWGLGAPQDAIVCR